jgi:hypothetical protein
MARKFGWRHSGRTYRMAFNEILSSYPANTVA